MNVAHNLDRPNVVLAATATGTAGAIVFALLPILAGQIADKLSLTDGQVGLISSAYFAMYSVISLTAPWWIRRFNWRYAALGGFATLLLGLSLLYVGNSAAAVTFAMAISGAGAAVLLPISLGLVALMNNKERAYGIVTALQQLVPTLMLLGISALWFGQYLLTTTVSLIGAIVVVSLLLSFALPIGATHAPTAAHNGQVGSHRAVIGLIGLALNFAGFAGMWTFLERIATEHGFDNEFTTRWIAIGLFMTALGPLISAALGNRFNRLLPLALPTLAAVASLSLLAGEVTTTTYAWVLVVFPLAYYISLSFILSVIADADSNGRIASLMSFALACGALLGPGVFGYLREAGGGTELWLIAFALGGGIALIIWVDLKGKHTDD